MDNAEARTNHRPKADQTCAPEIPQRYHLRWKSYARRRRWALGALVSWPLICTALFVLSRSWLHLPALSLLVMVSWLALALALVRWQGEFRCPRCNRRYAALGSRPGKNNWTRGLFDTVCSNCKLTKFEREPRSPDAL